MMASKWHAVSALDEALNETVELLFRRFNLRLWLKLAFVVFLVSGLGMGGPNFGGNWGGSGGDGNLDRLNIRWEEYLPLIAAVAAFFIFIALVFSFISSIASFVFIESVLRRNIEVVEGFRRHAENGLKYFLFRVFLGVVTILVLLAIILSVIFIADKFSGELRLILIAYVILVIVFFLIAVILLSIISSFTTDFVLLLMYSNKIGIVGGWRTLSSIIQKNFGQFLVYVLMKVCLGFIATIIVFAASIITSIFMLLVLIVVGVFLLLIALALGVGITFFLTHPAISLFLILLGVVFVVILLLFVSYAAVFITLPVSVFFRYYSILFFGRIHPNVSLAVDWSRKKKDTGDVQQKKRKDLSVY